MKKVYWLGLVLVVCILLVSVVLMRGGLKNTKITNKSKITYPCPSLPPSVENMTGTVYKVVMNEEDWLPYKYQILKDWTKIDEAAKNVNMGAYVKIVSGKYHGIKAFLRYRYFWKRNIIFCSVIPNREVEISNCKEKYRKENLIPPELDIGDHVSFSGVTECSGSPLRTGCDPVCKNGSIVIIPSKITILFTNSTKENETKEKKTRSVDSDM